MQSSVTRKNKIVLSDYNFKHDIGNRLLMANFSLFEVEVIKEILHGSLTQTVGKLAEALNVDSGKVSNSIDKILSTKLVVRKGDQILVDKDMRKYYEAQIVKFDDDFTPGLEFLQSCLRKVPIHVLPAWYAVPRTTDDIFTSIIERYLQTPTIYERYVTELGLESPVLQGIIHDVFSAPDFKVRSDTLREKYGLTREQFEETMLYLEFSFVCCPSYNRVGDYWKEVVTPFREWRDYLLFQHEKQAHSIKGSEVKRRRPHDFAFVEDLSALLNAAEQGPVNIATAASWLPQLAKDLGSDASAYMQSLVSRACLLELAEEKNGQIVLIAQARTWKNKAVQEQAIALYRAPFDTKQHPDIPSTLLSERNVRGIEKSLRRVLMTGWVLLDEFIAGMMAPVGQSQAVTLRQTGRRWAYEIPSYSLIERKLIEHTILERFFEAGLVAVGSYKGKTCFCITPFGKMAIGE